MLKKLETELKLRGFSEVTVKNYMRHNQLFLNYTKKEKKWLKKQILEKILKYLVRGFKDSKSLKQN